MNKQEKHKLGKLLVADNTLKKIYASEKAKDMNRYFTEVCLPKAKEHMINI